MLALAGGIFASGVCQAQSWQNATGKITLTQLSGDTNMAFRVSLSNNGTNPLSSCQYGWVFINNVAGENYQAKVAALMSIYAQGKSVTIYYVVQSDGFCRMADIQY